MNGAASPRPQAGKCHLLLDDTDLGVIEVWQNGIKIIDTVGTNLPLSDTILNRHQIGISATLEVVDLEIDDVTISGQSFAASGGFWLPGQ